MAASLSLNVGGEQLVVTHPDKVVFPEAGVTKLDLIQYYLAVADGALRGVADRPMILKRFVKGITEEAVFQKRAPQNRPAFVDVAELKYASGTSAKEAVIRDAAGLAWAINMGCVDLNPHPVRADDLAHPDELRVDLDPMPGVQWQQIVDVAFVAREVLEEHGLIEPAGHDERRRPYQLTAAGRAELTTAVNSLGAIAAEGARRLGIALQLPNPGWAQ